MFTTQTRRRNWNLRPILNGTSTWRLGVHASFALPSDSRTQKRLRVSVVNIYVGKRSA
jgi:hypothetical protein